MGIQITHEVLTKRGLVLYNDLQHDDETLGRTGDGLLVWTRILDVKTHTTTVCALMSERGTVIESTLDHPWVAQKGKDGLVGLTALKGLRRDSRIIAGGWYETDDAYATNVIRLYALLVAGRAHLHGRLNRSVVVDSTDDAFLRRILYGMDVRRYGSRINYTCMVSGDVAKEAINLLQYSVSDNVWRMGNYERQEFIETIYPSEDTFDIGVSLAVYLQDQRVSRGKLAESAIPKPRWSQTMTPNVDVFQLTTEIDSWTFRQGNHFLLTGG